MRNLLNRVVQFSTAFSLSLMVTSCFAAPVEPLVKPQEKVMTNLVRMETSKGDIVIKLDPQRAPQTVKNFLNYVDEGFYDNLVFHRVIPGFMVQGGGMNERMNQKPTKSPVYNESSNGLANKRGTIAMARTQAPNSATSQFFINLSENDFLNYRSGHPGYTVFGEVVEGMDAVDSIAKVQTGRQSGHSDVPNKPVFILKAKRFEEEKSEKMTDKQS